MSKPTQNRLKAERKRRGWSRKYVAEQIGVQEYTVGQWERDEHFPYPENIQKLCDLFGMSAEELGLVYGDEQMMPVQEAPPSPPAEYTPEITHADTADRTQANADVTSPPPLRRKQKRFLLLAGVVMFLLILGILGYGFLFKPAPIKPGGGWISPKGNIVGYRVHFEAYVYPTRPGDPTIDHVNFTAYWQGVDPRRWVIACTAYRPIRKDVFACDADLRKLGAFPGEIEISFDVYDQQGNHNNAPNGVHTLQYSP